MSRADQLSMFEKKETPTECCYRCRHFAEFKEARSFEDRSAGDISVFGMCCKGFCKNGSYYMYPIYVPEGACKDFKKVRKV